MTRLFDDETKNALVQAISHVESRSSAEVVVVARGKSGLYIHADLATAALGGLATLVFLLFSPWEHPLAFFIIEPVVVAAALGFLSSRTPTWRRWWTPEAIRRKWVHQAAQSVFLERGIHRTSARTGILVFFSQLEKMAEVICDIGIEEHAPEPEWTEAIEEIDEAIYVGETGPEIAKRVEKLADVLEPVLPRADDDVDELANEIVAS